MLIAHCSVVFRVTVVTLLTLNAGALAEREVAALPEQLPGIWRELEQGKGHSRVQDMREASSGKILSNFGAGSRIAVQFESPEPMPNARLYVRYNNAMNSEGQTAVSLWQEGGERHDVGVIVQTPSPQWNQFRWASVPIGSLERGVHHVDLLCPPGKASGGLDVAVLLDDRWQGIYQPPTEFKDGKPVGIGRLVSPIEATWKPAAPRGEFAADSPVVVQSTLHNRSAVPQDGELTWSVEDHAGTALASGKKLVAFKPGERQALDLRLTDAMSANGWYVARFKIGNVPVGECYFVCLPKITRPLPSEAMVRKMLIDGQQHWLGMNLGYGTPDDVLPDFREAGLKTIRTGGNKEHPAEHQVHVQQLIDAGLRIHWVLNYRGNGVNPPGTGINEIAALDLNGPVMKRWYDNYKARCRAFFEFYSKPGQERLRFYIVGNEPDKRDPHTGLAGRPDIAVRLTRAMAEAANEVNPTGIFVQSPSMAAPDSSYLRTMIVDLQVAHHCDIVGTHSYGSQTTDNRLGRPWVWLREAGTPRLVACTESGVSTGWTPRGYDPRQWQTDYMAFWYVKTRRFGYAAGILFTHDDDHKADWAAMRVKGEKLQPNWDTIQNVLTKPRTLINGGFEQPNEPLSMWIPEVDIDLTGWLGDLIDWQNADNPHAGKSSLRLTAPSRQRQLPANRDTAGARATEPLVVYHVITEGITPGEPVTVSACARASGTTAMLSIHGYDPFDGLATQSASTADAQWKPLRVTVTPVNPWIVVGLSAARVETGEHHAWFDSVEISH